MNCQKFFSSPITFFLELNRTQNDFAVPQSKLSSWLKRYFKWVKALQKNVKLDCVVDLFSQNLFIVFDKTVNLLESIASCNLSASVHVDFRDLVIHSEKMRFLEEKNLICCVNVHLGVNDLSYKTSFDRVMKCLCMQNAEIHLYASNELLELFNVFSSEILNKKGLSVFPQQTCEPVLAAPRYPVCACQKRLQLYVNDKGFIYPCQGLADIEKFAIGHVSDKSFEHYRLYKCNKDDLQTLVEKGPSLKRLGKAVEDSYPWICRRHLYELSRNASSKALVTMETEKK